MFNKMMKNVVDRIYLEDLDMQKDYIETVCGKVRRMDASICLEAKAFFVPNSEYLLQYAVPEMMDVKYDVFGYDGTCNWHSFLVFPIYDVGNSIVGLAGFNPVNYLKARETQDWTLNYYQYSNKNVLQKGRYIYTLPGMYEKALNAGYLIVVDGLFDALHLCSNGYNASSLMGSSITDEIIAQLRFLDKVIIVADNDEAGLALIKKLKYNLRNTVCLFQGKTKDVDELLKTDSKDVLLQKLDEMIESPLLVDRYL